MPPLFSRGSRFSSSTSEENHWLVVRKLEGQFAEVHEVKDTLSRERETRVRAATEMQGHACMHAGRMKWPATQHG